MEESKRLIISFDFDFTLSIPSIEEYAKMLIEKGVEVWVVTSRYDSIEKYFPEGWTIPQYHIKAYSDLYGVAERLGIPSEHIVFTNMEYKHTYFKDHPEFIWHLDDSREEVRLINEDTSVMGICWMTDVRTWKVTCSKLLFD